MHTPGAVTDEVAVPPFVYDTQRSYPRERVTHELFEAHVALHPGRVAVRLGDESLTYAELNRRANRLAHRLRAMHVGPDALVAVLLERSLDMVIALYAIWKAGGAYVPLDPAYPKDRLALMIEDSRATVVLTQPGLASLLDLQSTQTLLLEPQWQTTWRDADTNLDVTGTSENLAYVIYTSGSTGKPKGVQIPHRALVNFLTSMRDEPGLTEDDVVIGLTTLSFDIAGLEIHLPLTTGAQLVLITRDVAIDGRRLGAVIASSGATLVQATPATWRMLLDAQWQGGERLKLLCGGEALARDLADRLLPLCDSLWNMYGPTETTIWSTLKRVTQGTGATVPIGRPIANTQVYVLDESLQPVAPGEEGELFIGGDGVARGYLHREELTRERFLADPFAMEEGARMYRTGDAVRWREDGDLEYLHRLDNQVKVRGHRIELGEIEVALRAHPLVSDAVVTVRNDVPGGAALAAYWIAKGESAPSITDLRRHLQGSLPDYMLPSFFVRLSELPLTPNGKVDRRALPPPDASAVVADGERVAPRDAVEERLARIWCDVLRIPAVGIHDDFFLLGGESLLAVQLFTRIESELGRELPLATLLEAPTIAQLADRIRTDEYEAPWSPLIPMQTKGTATPFFCVHGVGGNVLNYRALADRMGEQRPFYALQARGLDGRALPLATIEEMAALYLSEIRRVQPHGPYRLGGASFGGVVAYEMAQQLRAAGDEAAVVVLFDTNAVTTASPDARQSLAARMQLHVNVLLRGPDRLAYLRKKVRRVWRKTVYRSWQSVAALFQKLGRQLPQSLQDVQQTNYRALRDYVAKPYDGRVVLFCARDEPRDFTLAKQESWRALTPQLEVIDVPGDHLSMIEEPNVNELAGRLGEVMNGARR